MQALGLVSSQQPQHRYKKAEQSDIGIPNRLDRQFDVNALNKVWAGVLHVSGRVDAGHILRWYWICLRVARWDGLYR
jgi:hypothetical protein